MTDRRIVAARIIRFDVEDSICLDCVTLESGEPFSIVVGLPQYGWRLVGLAALERWAERSTALRMTSVKTPFGRRVSIYDGSAKAVFDLVAEYPSKTPRLGGQAA